jgi:hypothetical protein
VDRQISPEACERSVDGPNGLLEFIRGRHEAALTALDGGNAR